MAQLLTSATTDGVTQFVYGHDLCLTVKKNVSKGEAKRLIRKYAEENGLEITHWWRDGWGDVNVTVKPK